MAEPFLTPEVALSSETPGGQRSGPIARVRVLVALRFVVMWNTLRRHPWQLVGAIFGLVYGLGILFTVFFGLIGLALAPPEVIRTVSVLGGAAIVLGWIVGPILFSGMERTLDPARLIAIPITTNVQLVGVAVSGLLGIPGIVTLLVAAMTAVAWYRSPIAALGAVLMAPVAAVTCVLACQLVLTGLSRVLASRRFREIIVGVLILLLVLLGPTITALAAGITTLGDRLPSFAEALSWSPIAAVWAVPAELASANWLAAAAKCVIALVTVVLLGVAWRALFLASRGSGGSGSRTGSRVGTGWFGRFPDTPRGAIAARALTYWLRDPRYLQSLLIVLVMPVVLGFSAQTSGLAILLPGSTVVSAALLSLSTFTDVSYDGTAFSTHVLRGVRGIDDRLGRIWANAIVAIPPLLLIAVVTTAIVGRFDQLPTLLGLTATVTLGGFGVASICSALFVMPVPQSGENPFVTKPGAAMLSMIGMAGSYGSLAVLSLPAIGFSIAAGVTGEPWLAWTTLVVGVLGGTIVCAIGIRWGAAIFDRRAPELLARVVAQA